MSDVWISLDLERLRQLLADAERIRDRMENCQEHATSCAQSVRVARRNGEDTTWLQELEQEYSGQAEEAATQLAETERGIQAEVAYLDRMSSYSIPRQLQLAHFLDEHGRDGSPVAQRAVMIVPGSVQQALALLVYLSGRGCYLDAAAAARQGYERFGDRLLRAQWVDMLDRAGQRDQVIALLREDLESTPSDLSVLERLTSELVHAGRLDEALVAMRAALAHPAGGSRLLGSFMVELVRAGRARDALDLAALYVRSVNNKADLRRELAELLRREGTLETSIAFLDEQAREYHGDAEIAGYRTAFLVNSARSDRPEVRKAALLLLHERRDSDVERQLQGLFENTRADELRLAMVAALGQIQGPDALPFLERALTLDSRRVRVAAARAVGDVMDAGSAAQTAAASEASRLARRILTARLEVEPEDGVRQTIVDALHRVDPRPRRFWERALGVRAWAEAQPHAAPLPTAQQRWRRAWLIAAAVGMAALVILAFLPVQPSPRDQALAAGLHYWEQGAGIVRTRIARRQATPTSPATVTPTVVRVAQEADTASGQVRDVTAADMIRVQLNGQSATVRYIGIDTPQTGQPGAQAAAEANRRLVATRLVRLESGAIPRDSSGRWLRYVWLPEGQMANERLLELGFGAPSPDPQDTRYQQRLIDAATKAWKEKAGFWRGGPDTYPMAAVRSMEANVREKPGTNQPVKLQLKQGAVLSVVGRNPTADWVLVRIPDHATGWMSTQVVDTTVPVRSLPVAQ